MVVAQAAMASLSLSVLYGESRDYTARIFRCEFLLYKKIKHRGVLDADQQSSLP